MNSVAFRSQSSAHGQGLQKREEYAKTDPPWHVFLNWEMYPVGNACRDSYRGINFPPRACLCTWVHAHAHISYPKRRFLLDSCTEVWVVARTAHSPCSFALCPSWQPDCLSQCLRTLPELFYSGLSFSYFSVTGFNICEYKSLRASATESDPIQTTVHPEICSHTCILAPISSHASLPGTSPQLACTLPLRQTVLPEMNAGISSFQQEKIFHYCPVNQLKWKESDAK